MDITIPLRYHDFSAHSGENLEGMGRISWRDRRYYVPWWWVSSFICHGGPEMLRCNILGAIYYAYVCAFSPVCLTDLTNIIGPWRAQSQSISLPISWAWFTSLKGPEVVMMSSQVPWYESTIRSHFLVIMYIRDQPQFRGFLSGFSTRCVEFTPSLDSIHLTITFLKYLIDNDIEGHAQHSPRNTCTRSIFLLSGFGLCLCVIELLFSKYLPTFQLFVHVKHSHDRKDSNHTGTHWSKPIRGRLGNTSSKRRSDLHYQALKIGSCFG